MISAGWRQARQRLWSRRPLLSVMGGGLFVLLAAAAELQQQTRGALDRTLLGAVFGLSLPLVAYGIVGRLVGRRRANLIRELNNLARFGLNRRLLLIGALAMGGLCASAVALALSLEALGLAASSTQPWGAELVALGWISVLGALAYVILFGLGASLGSKGQGRFWLLILDWILGQGSGILAAPWPRAHLRNLLGGAPVLEMSQSAAGMSLGLLVLLYFGVLCRRTSP